MLRSVSQDQEAAIPVLRSPDQGTVGEQLRDDYHVPGARCDIDDRRMGLRISIFAVGDEKIFRAFELAFVRARNNNETAVSGEYIGEVDEEHQIVTVDTPILTKIAWPLHTVIFFPTTVQLEETTVFVRINAQGTADKLRFIVG